MEGKGAPEGPAGPGIRTRPVPSCPLCGTAGPVLHGGLRDGLFGAPGEWSFRRCPAPSCGLLWLDPAPLPADLALAYEGYYTHAVRPPRRETALRRLARAARAGFLANQYGAPSPGAGGRLLGLLPHLHPVWRAEIRHRAMHLRVIPGGRLLEVGCGAGELLGEARDLGWSVTGVDFDPAAAATARGRGLEVLEGDLAAQGLPAASFDAAVLYHLVEHVPDPRGLLAECARVVRPGGRLVVATPNPLSRGHRRFGPAWRGLEPPRHLHLLPPALLAAEAERAGFRVEGRWTSVRDAVVMWTAGRSIEGTGGWDGGPPPSLLERVRAVDFALGSWFAGWWDRDARDETVLVGVRTSDPGL